MTLDPAWRKEFARDNELLLFARKRERDRQTDRQTETERGEKKRTKWVLFNR